LSRHVPSRSGHELDDGPADQVFPLSAKKVLQGPADLDDNAIAAEHHGVECLSREIAKTRFAFLQQGRHPLAVAHVPDGRHANGTLTESPLLAVQLGAKTRAVLTDGRYDVLALDAVCHAVQDLGQVLWRDA
jgi:hypothetical protein